MMFFLPCCFRPLYRGLFSIVGNDDDDDNTEDVFVPFIGDFFQSFYHGVRENSLKVETFSSPLSGTFFNRSLTTSYSNPMNVVFVPFIGDFFQSMKRNTTRKSAQKVFVPFIGDFFQSPSNPWTWEDIKEGFRPLYRGLFSIPCLYTYHNHPPHFVFVPFIGDFFQSRHVKTHG